MLKHCSHFLKPPLPVSCCAPLLKSPIFTFNHSAVVALFQRIAYLVLVLLPRPIIDLLNDSVPNMKHSGRNDIDDEPGATNVPTPIN